MTDYSKPVKIWKVGTLVYTTGGLVVLFCWLLWGDFSFQMRDRAIPPIMQLLFKRFGASDMLTGILLASLPAALGLVIMPIVGYKSDRLRSRWGRRIPFLLIPTPVIVLSILGLAFSPQLGGYAQNYLGPHFPGAGKVILVVIGLFWAIFEMSCITANTVLGGLINDVVPQAIIGRFFAFFRQISLIAGIIFNYWLMGKAETHYLGIILGMGALYGFGFTIMCLNVKEGDYPPPPQLPGRAHGPWTAIKTYFKDGFGHSYYLWYFATVILMGLAAFPVNLYSVFYAKSIGMDLDLYGKCFALTYACSLFLAYPLGALADRFHPLRLGMVALVLYGLAVAWGACFARDVHTFAIALVLHGVLSGTLFTSTASIAQRLLPRARFTEIASAGGVIGSIVGIFSAPAVGMFLDHFHHDYRYTFWGSLGFTVLSLGSSLVLHRKFMALGGPKHYVAPA